MKKLLVCILSLMMALSLTMSALAAGGDGSGGGNGDGGGVAVPTAGSISISNVTETSATATFHFSNNIGANAGYNKQFFYVNDENGGSVSFSMKFWSEGDDRRNARMTLSGLEPGKTYTVGVRAGVRSKNGQTTKSGSSKSFTTKEAEAPVAEETPAPTVTVLPTATAEPTAAPTSEAAPTPETTSAPVPAKTPEPTERPAATPKPTATPRPTVTVKPTATVRPTHTPPAATPAAEAAPGPQTTFGVWGGDSAIISTAAPIDAAADASGGDGPGSGDGSGGGKSQPLTLVSGTIADGQRDVPVDTEITLTFSKNVTYLAVRENNAKAVTLWKGDEQVPVEIYMADDQLEREKRNDIVIKPLSPLDEGTEYTIRVDTTLTAKSTARLQEECVLTFYTVGYSEPPQVWVIVGICVLIAAIIAVAVVMKRRKVR